MADDWVMLCPLCAKPINHRSGELAQWAEPHGDNKIEIWGPFHKNCIAEQEHGRIGPSRIMELPTH